MVQITQESLEAIVGDQLDPILERLEKMQRAQMKANSRIVRLAFMASISSQVALVMLLINSSSPIAAVANLLAIGVTVLAGWKIIPDMGREEWPTEEADSYEPYDSGR